MGARLSPQVFMPLFVEGMTCYKLEDYRQAAASLGRADALLPEHAGCKLFLAGSYEKLGNRAQAAQAYRQVAISDKGELGRAARARLMALGYKVN
jgi:predicted TPR repeat methyltransferase